MSMLILAISCLTTSNLPWFMGLTFQVPMQYFSLQHWTLLPSPVTSTTGCCFCFGSISSLFLELFLHWSPVAYWAPTNLGSSSFSVLYFCLFILFMGFSRQEYWISLTFPSPVDHILSELSTMTHPSSVQFSRSVVSNSLRPHELQHARPPCPSPTPRVHSDSRPSSQWCHPAISSSVSPSPPAPNTSQHQSLFQWVNASHEVAKVLEFQLQHHCFQRNPRTDLLLNELVGSPCIRLDWP